VKLSKLWLIALSLAAVLIIAGCGKKQPPPPPATPPPPPAPTASISANPDTITEGDATTLTWKTDNATEVTIDNGVGTVDANGSRRVNPTQTTTYTLSAKGAGGTQTATATVTVNAKPAPPPPQMTDEEMFAQNVKDVFFDFDKSDIRPGVDSQNVQADAQFLAAHPNLKFTIEGHCDERGSTDYNLTLGNERANSVAQALQKAGVPASQMRVVTFGKEKPFCSEHTEDCWQQNRRAHFVLSK
jgi:peptidoglycan-associated lipoprotein